MADHGINSEYNRDTPGMRLLADLDKSGKGEFQKQKSNRVSHLLTSINLPEVTQADPAEVLNRIEVSDSQDIQPQQAVAQIGTNSLLESQPSAPSRVDKIKYYLVSIICDLALKIIKKLNALIAPAPQESREVSSPETDTLNSYEGRLVNGNDIFKVACKTYDDKHGNIYAEQTLFREDAKERHLEMMINTSERLENEIQELTDNGAAEEEIRPLARELSLCQQEIANALSLKRDYISSNYVRDVLEENRLRNYSEEVKEICSGAPVNHRYNQVQIAGELVGGHCDLGVIAYHGNSLTNLKELKEMEHNPDKLETKRQMLQELRGRIAAKSGSFEREKTLQAVDFALEQISTPEKLKEALDDRRFFLRSQFLHLLRSQLEHNLDGIDRFSDDPFTMVQLSLLNPRTSNIDTTGWAHDEKNQMLDMREIYNEFNGKPVVFDNSGPFIDRDGTIHMPFDRGGDRINLETIFFNISVQGYTQNTDVQQHVNESAIEKLLVRSSRIIAQSIDEDGELDPDLLEAQALLQNVYQRLNAGESSYKLAEDLGYAMTRMNIAMSINCLSAKDRTGYVSTRIILRHVIARLDELLKIGVISEDEYRKLKQEFELSIVSPDSCPAKNVFDNTGTSVLKCSAYQLPGYTEAKYGDARRLAYFILQGSLIIDSKVQKKKQLNERRWEYLNRNPQAAPAA